MRPGQNKRMRGGRSNNRKAPNPLTRSYESNGPDVKIRGTAHHVGEKYLQLARDAQSSGDPVMAESYLQHAEHYFRLIAAAQQAQQQAAYGYQRQPGEAETEEFEEDDDFGGIPDRFASPIERFPAPAAAQPQPYASQPNHNGAQPSYQQERPFYGNGNGNGHSERPNYERPERQERGPRQDRNFQERNFQGQDRNNQDRNNQDRNNQDRAGQERNFQDRGGQERNFQERPSYPDRQPQSRDQGQGRDQNRDRDQDQRGPRRSRDYRGEPRGLIQEPEAALPAFITAPVRIQPEVHMGDQADEGLSREMIAQPEVESDANGFLLRPRRRRRTKAEIANEGFRGEPSNASDPVD